MIGSAAVIAASVLLGAVVDPLVGVALFAGALAGAVIWELASSDPTDAARSAKRRPPAD